MIGKSVILSKPVKWAYGGQLKLFIKFHCCAAISSRGGHETAHCSQNATKHGSRHTLSNNVMQHELLLKAHKNRTFLKNTKTFSTSTQTLSAAEKIRAIYDVFERQDSRRSAFAKKFAASRFVNAAPEWLQPYLRLARVDKPIGTWLLYLPCAFGITLAAPLGSLPSLYYLGLFGAGAFLMRGAGCVINDLWDRKIDSQVARTKERPLASGEIKPINAIALLAVQLSLSLGILLSLNTTCIMIGVAAMLPVILYPLAKRVTYFPQVVLGFTFNIGAVMGYAAVSGSINWLVVLPLYLGCFFWTLYYDTIYAMQDMFDDARTGVKSLALLFSSDDVRDEERFLKMSVGERMSELDSDKKNLVGFLTSINLLTNGLWIVSVLSVNAAFPAYIAPVLTAIKFTKDDHGVGENNLYGETFLKSRNIGLAVLISFIFGMFIAYPENGISKEVD